MDEIVATTPKKTARTRKTALSQDTPAQVDTAPIVQDFDELVTRIIKTKGEFDNLQKEIAQVKQDWAREQKQHEADLAQQKTQEELERKREEETYQYNTNLTRKRAEDEFTDKKMAWEKELAQRKDELDEQRKELEELRKQVSGFDSQKEQVVKEAQEQVEQQLSDRYETERKLREQEVKAEKEVLGLKISNLEGENSRLTKEIEILKRSLDEATRQVKEIAVKVIESGQPKTQTTSES